jgi:hypothetical protein
MKNIAVLVDLMLTLPPTSVRCETAFPQLKLLKTCRRSRLGQGVLNDLMAVKLLSISFGIQPRFKHSEMAGNYIQCFGSSSLTESLIFKMRALRVH